jgi:hypothetical protein
MGLRSRHQGSVTTSPADQALGLVDTALSFATRREIFTADEVSELLDGVGGKVAEPRIRSIVEDAAAVAAGADVGVALIERSTVVDRLLDLRLAVSNSSCTATPSRAPTP